MNEKTMGYFALERIEVTFPTGYRKPVYVVAKGKQVKEEYVPQVHLNLLLEAGSVEYREVGDAAET